MEGDEALMFEEVQGKLFVRRQVSSIKGTGKAKEKRWVTLKEGKVKGKGETNSRCV